MWLKLGQEFLNLHHVVRVNFSTGWKKEREELVAQVEGYVRGNIEGLARYRGPEAEALRRFLEELSQKVEIPATPEPKPTDTAVNSKETMTEIELPQSTHSAPNTIHDF